MSAVFNPVQAMSAFLLHDPHVAPAFARVFKPLVVGVSIGYPNPWDDSLDWTTVPMSRNDAAKAIRAARKRGLLIERSTTGYSISGDTHPAWRT